MRCVRCRQDNNQVHIVKIVVNEIAVHRTDLLCIPCRRVAVDAWQKAITPEKLEAAA